MNRDRRAVGVSINGLVAVDVSRALAKTFEPVILIDGVTDEIGHDFELPPIGISFTDDGATAAIFVANRYGVERHRSFVVKSVRVYWPDQQLYRSGALSAPSGSASQMLCALFPAEMKKLLTTGITDLRGTIPGAERPRLIMAALDAGLEVHRRIDASPWAILYSAAEEAARAEAAE